MRAAGFVLVGGRSSRMGQDKALLRVNSHAFVEEVAARVRDVAGNVALIGAPERYRALELECLPDLRPGLGPLAGIETALASGRGEWNLITACDMPGLETRWLRMLCEGAEQAGSICTVLRDADGVLQPLCGVFHVRCLPEIKRLLDKRKLRLQDAIYELDATIVDVSAPVANVNTRAEWAAWQASAGIPTSDAG